MIDAFLEPFKLILRLSALSVRIAFLSCLLASAVQAQSLYEAALSEMDKGQAETAIIYLKNLLKNDVNNLAARVLLSEAYIATGDGAAAEEEINRARRLGADFNTTIIPLGNAHMIQGKYQALLETIRAIGQDPDFLSQIATLRGQAQTELQQFAEAEAEFLNAQNLNAGATGPLAGLMRLAMLQYRFDEAQGYLDRLILIDPNSIVRWTLTGDLRNAEGKAAAALTAYENAVLLAPGRADLKLYRAALYFDLGRTEEARDDIEAVLAKIPRHPNAHYLKGLVLDRLGQSGEARQALEEAGEVLTALPEDFLNTNRHLLLLKGQVFYALGQYETAYDSLEKFSSLSPRDVAGAKLLASSLLALGNAVRARDVLEPLIGIVPGDGDFYFLLGAAYMELGGYERGISYYEQAVALDPQSSSAAMRLGLGQLTAGNIDEAIKRFQSAILIDPDDVSATIALTLVALDSGEISAAVEAAQRLLQRRQNDPYVLNLMGAVYIQAGRHEEAQARLREALALSSGYISAELNLAQSYLQQGRFDDASSLYVRILARDSKQPDALKGLGAVARRQNKPGEATGWFLKARDVQPDDPAIWRQLIALKTASGAVEEALAMARKFSGGHPENEEFKDMIGRLLIALNRADEAEQHYQKIVEESDDRGLALANLADARIAGGDLNGAADALRRALSWQPGKVEIYAALIPVELRLGDAAEALRLAKELQQAAPGHVTAYQMLGTAEAANGNLRGAAQTFRKGLENHQDTGLAIGLHRALLNQGNQTAGLRVLEDWIKNHPADSRARIMLADSYSGLGQYDAAARLYETVLEGNRQDFVALNNLAWAYYKTGSAKAVDTAARAYEANPQSASVIDTYAWILFEGGQTERALSLLREARVKASRNPLIRYHLGRVLLAGGRAQEGRREIQEALRLAGNFDGADEARRILSEGN